MRLIEPEQITKMLSDLYISEDAVNMTGERQGLWVRFRTIEKAVSEIPTIDAVKVVRCKDCAELEVDLRSKWTRFIGMPLSYAHLYGTKECKRDAYHKERREE